MKAAELADQKPVAFEQTPTPAETTPNRTEYADAPSKPATAPSKPTPTPADKAPLPSKTTPTPAGQATNPANLSGDEAQRIATSTAAVDWAAVGFRCGLEIHQQLDTRKLFSPCPSDVVDPDAVAARSVAQYDRRLRATQSELGEVDVAALAEAKKQRRFRYLAIEGLTSLVELDEEPPHPLCEDALDVALTFATLLGARPADEVHVMRKTVIDGSNTGGFQRTTLVATGGRVEPEGGPGVGIWTIALEEDSARKFAESDGLVTFTLDRLGIPLIEVATAPDIRDPQHAQRTAARLGSLLRATGRVKRGLGTIRQDLNVSVAVGDRVEIKGCQDLRAVPRVIEGEVRRQLWNHHIAVTLKARGFTRDQLDDPRDVTVHFATCESKVVKDALGRSRKVMGLALPNWAGLIQGASKDGPRLGREFADHAKVAAGVKGVFHSDELPAYGIGEAEVEAVRTALHLGEQDGFVLCVEKERTARRALEAVAERAAQALLGTTQEVRAAQPDDSTRYMRPLPGAARMYPETDVPPTRITAEHLASIHDTLPPLPEQKVDRYVEQGVSRDVAQQLVRDGRDGDFDDLVRAHVEPGLSARILLQYLPDLEAPERVLGHVPQLAGLLRDGQFAKEAVPAILQALDKDPSRTVESAIQATGAQAADESEVDAVIERAVQERIDFIRDRGSAAIGPLMGPVMAQLRGKADGAVISAKLKAAIAKALQ